MRFQHAAALAACCCLHLSSMAVTARGDVPGSPASTTVVRGSVGVTPERPVVVRRLNLFGEGRLKITGSLKLSVEKDTDTCQGPPRTNQQGNGIGQQQQQSSSNAQSGAVGSSQGTQQTGNTVGGPTPAPKQQQQQQQQQSGVGVGGGTQAQGTNVPTQQPQQQQQQPGASGGGGAQAADAKLPTQQQQQAGADKSGGGAQAQSTGGAQAQGTGVNLPPQQQQQQQTGGQQQQEDDLCSRGHSAYYLSNTKGVTLDVLAKCGFAFEDLKRAGFSDKQLDAAGVKRAASAEPPRTNQTSDSNAGDTDNGNSVLVLVGIAAAAVVLGMCLGVASRFRSAGNDAATIRATLEAPPPSRGQAALGAHQVNAAYSDETYEPINTYAAVGEGQARPTLRMQSDGEMTDYTNTGEEGRRPSVHVQQGQGIYDVPVDLPPRPAKGGAALNMTRGHTAPAVGVYGDDSSYAMASATPSHTTA